LSSGNTVLDRENRPGIHCETCAERGSVSRSSEPSLKTPLNSSQSVFFGSLCSRRIAHASDLPANRTAVRLCLHDTGTESSGCVNTAQNTSGGPADGVNPPGAQAPHAVLTEFYSTPESRASFVNKLFDSTAQHYDRMSGILSFGSDKHYRRMALRRAGLEAGHKLLDVATGTGLVLQAALDLGMRAEDLTGIDPSAGMLEENRKRHPVRLLQGVGERLPFPDASFDFISMGYALRHVEDLGTLFAEFRRVLRPNGRVLILEISRPKSKVLFFFMNLYMGKLVPFLTRLFTGGRDTARLMEYYWATIAECVPPATILEALNAAGFKEVQRRVTGGVLSDYLALNKRGAPVPATA
jgi:demethylmenaquinone methyltransferase/2-methoxy-6-polyprenyl-1,4-benzoquinol methylase